MFKFSGAGNDFVVLDGRQGGMEPFRESARIGELCRKYRTDGLMILGEADGVDFTMEFYNPDGSGGMMCGNGGRCIVAFADYLGLQPAAPDGIWHFRAPDGLHTAQILKKPNCQSELSSCHSEFPSCHSERSEESSDAMPPTDPSSPSAPQDDRNNTAPQDDNTSQWTVRLKMIDVQGITPMKGGCFLNTGTRHFVKFVDSVDTLNMEEAAKPLRWDAAFQPEGSNVNLVEVRSDGLHVRTYEKGVEGETLACGTGLTASALAAYRQGIPAAAPYSYRLQCRRGDWLQVDFRPEGEGFRDVYLTGPAELVELSA